MKEAINLLFVSRELKYSIIAAYALHRAQIFGWILNNPFELSEKGRKAAIAMLGNGDAWLDRYIMKTVVYKMAKKGNFKGDYDELLSVVSASLEKGYET